MTFVIAGWRPPSHILSHFDVASVARGHAFATRTATAPDGFFGTDRISFRDYSVDDPIVQLL